MSDSALAGFLEMGGYALYVWGSFAMCGAAALWEAVLLVHRRRRALDRRAHRVLVVLAHEQARQAPQHRHVVRLEQLALVRRAVAEVGH